ncbi:MAG: type II toxin-antitoxin system RelE/ParE family toxin [Alphaproteobacteria bacterium]|nr:type II toxin-antitoxin system RelE/ParE family toxin [Alphaproteobacteria bacterium]MBV9693341.1 type II toxin-antitoxin system RelE/ParE family toxin [Alphaproteobacteria bacterium]
MPKQRTVFISESAARDIEQIGLYIAEHGDAATALRIIEALEKRCNSLDQLAERGNRPKELIAVGITKYRELHYKSYRIVYDVAGLRVTVHAILDGRRDMNTLLRQRLPR